MVPHRSHSDFDLDFDSDSLWEVTWAFEGEAFETLRSLAQEKFYKARTNVFEQGDPPDGMYLVLDGFALVIAKDAERNVERTVGIVQAGQSFGELGLLVEQPRMACVSAGTDLRLLHITEETLASLEEQNPHIAAMMYKMLARTLAAQLIERGNLLKALEEE